MTQLLEEAIRRASELPAEMQDHLGAVLLEELEADREWEQTLESPESIGLLRAMAAEARAEYEAGRTRVLDPDSM